MEPLHDDEADTGSEVVLDLLRSQAPHLAARSLARISGTAGNTGSDNVLYRLGTELVVRLPRTPSAAASLRTETRLLPHLAGRLPVALPELVHLGSASARYPHPWAVLRWLPGRDAWADRATLDDPHGFRLAEDLAAVVDAVGKVPRAAYGDIVEVRPPGRRGGGLAPLTEDIDEWLGEAHGLVDERGVRASWQESLSAREWDGDAVLCHGDLIPGNLLVQGNRLTAVIDWGGAGAGDPALDLVPAWAVLGPQGRERFRDGVAADDDSWLRARGYALQQAVAGVIYYTPRRHPLADVMRRTLHAILR